MSAGSHLLVLPVFRSGSQDCLLHHLRRDQGQTEEPGVPQIFAVLEYRSDAVGAKSFFLISR